MTHPVVIRTLLAGAAIRIGNDVGLSGTSICSASSIIIGDRVLVGADVIICDTDFHPIDSSSRRYSPIPTPESGDAVVIESDVFLGARSVVLKGVTIGASSVVGAGSVVTKSVEPYSIVAGNPAKVIGRIR
ncbi:acyltransferase [Williamsia sp.]|uniref:acyltransferase n=1 Tax=Williamsia sp. TaxID=1872085 RepID=UPI001A2DCDF7|nr:acyltransferase [Williamsia sp.]